MAARDRAPCAAPECATLLLMNTSDQTDLSDPMPVAPRAPGDDECCQSGCAFCVHDLYTDELQQYRLALQAWQERHAAALRG